MGGRITKVFIVLRPKMYSYLTDDDCVNKKAKSTKTCVIKSKFRFKDYKIFLKENGRSKYLEVKRTIYFQKRFTRSHYVREMMTDYKRVMELSYIRVAQVLGECSKQN